MKWVVGLVLSSTLVLGDSALAQQPASGPRFEVAAIKPNKSGDNSIRIGLQPGGRFTATNVPLRQLIRFAYQLQDFQIVGGPDWIKNDRFDIVAKAEGDIPPGPIGEVGPMQLMMRALLADRFKLTVHEDDREMPIYSLVVARADRKLGANLQPSTVDCPGMMAAAGRAGTPPPPPSPTGRPVCGMQIGRGRVMGGSFPIAQFAGTLAPLVQRFVVDRTGLSGNYDIEMTFTPEQPQGDLAAAAPPVDSNGPSIFTALQEQLGLKLEAGRGPVRVLVIDSAEIPKED